MEELDQPKMGRPPVDIDWEQFDTLCKIHATLEEIAYFFKCCIETIQNRVKAEKGVTFSTYYAQVSIGGRLSLRRHMWEHALKKDNPEMQRFLSKQKPERGGLGFSDKTTNELEVGDGSFEKMMGFCDRMEKEKAEEAK